MGPKSTVRFNSTYPKMVPRVYKLPGLGEEKYFHLSASNLKIFLACFQIAGMENCSYKMETTL
jgi:hypothetical protein